MSREMDHYTILYYTILYYTRVYACTFLQKAIRWHKLRAELQPAARGIPGTHMVVSLDRGMQLWTHNTIIRLVITLKILKRYSCNFGKSLYQV